MQVIEGIRVTDTMLFGDSGEASSDLAVTVRPVLPAPRSKNFQALPFASPFVAPLSVDRNDQATLVAGLTKRMGRVLPDPDADFFSDFKAFTLRWCQDHLVPLQSVLSFEEWLDSTSYNMSRKDELRHVHELMSGALPTKKQMEKIKSFVKLESYPEFKHARWINSRSDAFKVFSGPFFKSIEKSVYTDPHFIKNVPVTDRSEFINRLRFTNAQYLSTDFTAFESHFRPALLDACECCLYKHMLKNFPEAFGCIRDALVGNNRGSTRRGVSFVIKGRRMSGDMCTSLGNGFTNLMVFSFLMHKFRPGQPWDGVVEGDDGLFSHGGERLTTDLYARCGWTMKNMEYVDDIGAASFCGMIFGRDGQMLRDPFKFMQNFAWTDRVGVSDKTALELLLAKSLSSIYETPQCPVIRAYAEMSMCYAAARGAHPRFILDGYHSVPPDDWEMPLYNPTDATRDLFAHKFGICPEEQQVLESKIRSMNLTDVWLRLQTTPAAIASSLSRIYQ